jgi:23S rRNA pseudouridine1911/1915/1917 synthase
VISEVLPEALEGERLDRVVALLTGASRSAARALVEEGHVTHNGSTATAGRARVAAGDRVEVDAVPVAAGGAARPPEPEPEVAVEVVHEDHHLVVVDKAAGLVVHPGAGHAGGTLVNGLLARYPEMSGVGEPARPGIVHRLDRDTSGLLVAARTQEAYEGLVAALAGRRVRRRYDALVLGTPTSPSGVVEAPVGRSPRARTRMAVTAGGKPARTRYDVVATWTDPVPVARLSCTLETGRTHQIRVHLAAIDLPVLGDATYGRPDPLGVERPMLHAAELAFDHPVSGERIDVSSPLPADFAGVLARLAP